MLFTRRSLRVGLLRKPLNVGGVLPLATGQGPEPIREEETAQSSTHAGIRRSRSRHLGRLTCRMAKRAARAKRAGSRTAAGLG